jgi:iron complex outermembrane receptor protein
MPGGYTNAGAASSSATRPAGAAPSAPQDGYYKGPTTIDKINAARLDFTHDLQGGMFSDLQFGANLTERTKDRKAVEALIVSSAPPAGGRQPIAYPAGSYVENNVGGSGVNLLTFDPTGRPVPGRGLAAEVQRRHPVQDLERQGERVDRLRQARHRHRDGQGPGARQRGPATTSTRTSRSGFRADIGSDVTLTNPAKRRDDQRHAYNDVLPTLNLVGRPRQRQPAAFRRRHRDRPPDADRHAQLVHRRLQRHRTLVNANGVRRHHLSGELVGSGGNPYLKPFKAKALDLSYEKYFANKEGYLSAALFYKHLGHVHRPVHLDNYDFTSAAHAVGITSVPPAATNWRRVHVDGQRLGRQPEGHRADGADLRSRC